MGINVEIANLQKIIESNMRSGGYGPPTISNEYWKDLANLKLIDPENPDTSVALPFNLKIIRDIISQSILDALTGIMGTGSQSQGDTPGDPGKSGNNDDIGLNSDNDINLNGDTSITGSLSVSVDGQINGTLTVTGEVIVATLVTSGNITDGTCTVTVLEAKTAYDHSQVSGANPHATIASQISITDAGGRYTATQIDAALQEIAGPGRTNETVKGANDNALSHASRHVNGDAIRNATPSQKGLMTLDQAGRLANIEDNADVTDPANVKAAGAIVDTDLDGRGEIITATGDDAPVILAAGNAGDKLIATPSQPKGLSWRPHTDRVLLSGWARVSYDPLSPGVHAPAYEKTYLLCTDITSDITVFNCNMDTFDGTPKKPVGWGHSFDDSDEENAIKHEGTASWKRVDSDNTQLESSWTALVEGDYANKILTATLWHYADTASTWVRFNIREENGSMELAHYACGVTAWKQLASSMKFSANGGDATHRLQFQIYDNTTGGGGWVGTTYIDDLRLFMGTDVSSYPNEATDGYDIVVGGVTLSRQASVVNVEANDNSYFRDPVNHVFYINVGGADPSLSEIYWVAKVTDGVNRISVKDVIAQINRKELATWVKISDDPVLRPGGSYLVKGTDLLENTYMFAEDVSSQITNYVHNDIFNADFKNWDNGNPKFMSYRPLWNTYWKELVIKRTGTQGFGGEDLNASAEATIRATCRDGITHLANRIVTFSIYGRADAIMNPFSMQFQEVGNAYVFVQYPNFPADTWFNFYGTILFSANVGQAGGNEVYFWPGYGSEDAFQGKVYFDEMRCYAHISTMGFPNEATGEYDVTSDGMILTSRGSIALVDANVNSYYLDPVNHAFYLNVGADPATKTIYWERKIRPQVITSEELDLSEAAVDIAAVHAERRFSIYKAYWLYTEGSSADTGIGLRIGKELDDDYYYSGTSEVSKAQWYVKDITASIADKIVVAGDTLTFGMVGGKTGAGKVKLCLEIVPDIV